MDINKFIGYKKPKLERMPRNPFAYAIKDNDKDKVINILDCQPNNPKKQGFIHDIAKKGSNAFLKGKTKKKVDTYISKKEMEAEENKKFKEKVRKAAMEERNKQEMKTAVYREQQKAERQRNYIKSGGFLGTIGRGLDALAKPEPTYTRTRKGSKKGKRKQKSKSKKRMERREPKQLSDFKFDMPF